MDLGDVPTWVAATTTLAASLVGGWLGWRTAKANERPAAAEERSAEVAALALQASQPAVSIEVGLIRADSADFDDETQSRLGPSRMGVWRS